MANMIESLDGKRKISGSRNHSPTSPAHGSTFTNRGITSPLQFDESVPVKKVSVWGLLLGQEYGLSFCRQFPRVFRRRNETDDEKLAEYRKNSKRVFPCFTWC
jgi:hypothetical protein